MSTTTYYPRARSPQSPAGIIIQVIAAAAGGVGLFLLLLVVTFIGFTALHAGRIYPGVSMAGIDLAGLTPVEATDRIARNMIFPQTGKIVFEDGGQIWVTTPAELGLSLDFQANAQAAYQLGREGSLIDRAANLLQAWRGGISLAPRLTYNEQAAQDYLARIAAQLNQPLQEAALKLEGVNIVAVPGQVGRALDIEASLQNLRLQMTTLSDGVIPLVITETHPEIMDASQQAETARRILSQPLTLIIPDSKEGDPGPWRLPPSQLAQMLTIERVKAESGAAIQVKLSPESLSTYLSALAGDINLSPANARFMFNDETRLLEVIQPAVTGRSLDIQATILAINEKLENQEHTVPLVLSYNPPEVGDDATGAALGITENVVTYTSYFRGSSTERLHNIKIAAANFHGLLVPPGATFSMANVMGNVSLDNGYSEAWIIFGGRTIKGVGGGVCQVSTTLFRAAFMAGFPIQERHPHAYRVGYYEQTASGYDAKLAGLDATVFVPMVDFKFVNDSPYWLLMETYFYPNSRSLTWKFYSTSDGRKVEWDTSGPQFIVEPPDPVFEENPDLAQGEVKQVDWEAEGADVTATRTVYKNGQVHFSDSFRTHYLPWAAVYQYGPGTNLDKWIKKNLKPPIVITP